MRKLVDLKHIKQKPWLIDILPGIGKATGQAVYPNVYLPRKLYANIINNAADPYSEALVIHEQEHLKRMREHGVAKWYLQNILSGKFRFTEELAATKAQFAYVKAKGLTFNIERKARSLSGLLYFWASKYDVALAELNKMWQEV